MPVVGKLSKWKSGNNSLDSKVSPGLWPTINNSEVLLSCFLIKLIISLGIARYSWGSIFKISGDNPRVSINVFDVETARFALLDNKSFGDISFFGSLNAIYVDYPFSLQLDVYVGYDG